MISFLIPIYNAEKIIQPNYEILKKQLGKIRSDYEILFADDASSDRSKHVLGEIAHLDDKVKILSHCPNQGLGFTLRQLFKYARGDIMVYLDIDLPFGVENLSGLLEEMENADVVLASRYAVLQSRIPIAREVTSRLYYFVCKVLFAISVKDLGSGLVIFKRKVLGSLNLSARGFDIHIELFAKIKKQGFLVKEVPQRYIYNGYSTFSILRHGPAIIVNTLKFWLNNR